MQTFTKLGPKMLFCVISSKAAAPSIQTELCCKAVKMFMMLKDELSKQRKCSSGAKKTLSMRSLKITSEEDLLVEFQ